VIDQVNNLLSRMKKVKTRGRDKWMACCPAHEDKNPSLAITLDKGKILMKCWSGCDVESILGAIGLEFKDIMPEQPLYQRSSGKKPTMYATDALRILKVESMIITMCALDIKHKRPIADDDMDRVMLAMERINLAMEAADVQL
jgi:hypothetical protein